MALLGPGGRTDSPTRYVSLENQKQKCCSRQRTWRVLCQRPDSMLASLRRAWTSVLDPRPRHVPTARTGTANQSCCQGCPWLWPLWHWYWRVQTGLVWGSSSKGMPFLFWLVHTLLCSGPMCLPPTFSSGTPSKSYDEGDPSPCMHRMQAQGGLSKPKRLVTLLRVKITGAEDLDLFELQQEKPIGRRASPTSCPTPNYWSTCTA